MNDKENMGQQMLEFTMKPPGHNGQHIEIRMQMFVSGTEEAREAGENAALLIEAFLAGFAD